METCGQPKLPEVCALPVKYSPASLGELPTLEEPMPSQTGTEQHPFAEFIRIIGRGPTLSRSLSETEAERAMTMILDGEVDAAQLGGLMVVLRFRAETPAELAGFVHAARRRFTKFPLMAADLDWPSYADRHKQLPYFVLAALLLATNGVKVLMHGLEGEGPVTTPATIAALGVPVSRSPSEAARGLDTSDFAYLPLEAFCPSLSRLFSLRPLLGLRSPANTFGRELNPGTAPHQIQGVFHPTYLPTHQETARLLQQPKAAIFKGGGGEAQRNPEKPCRVALLEGTECREETWAPLRPDERHPWRDEPLDPHRLRDLWQGHWAPPGPVAAIIGTAAIALKLLGRVATQADAEALAASM